MGNKKKQLWFKAKSVKNPKTELHSEANIGMRICAVFLVGIRECKCKSMESHEGMKQREQNSIQKI